MDYPTLPDNSPNPYYQPAVTPSTWEFAPYGDAGAALQPNPSTWNYIRSHGMCIPLH